jgi:hypothetical protein
LCQFGTPTESPCQPHHLTVFARTQEHESERTCSPELHRPAPPPVDVGRLRQPPLTHMR